MKLLLLTLTLVAACSARTIIDGQVQDHGRGQPRGGCVADCTGKVNGDYQSCKSCKIYVSCVAGQLVDDRPCPAGLVWNDRVKMCLHYSSTCKESESDETTSTAKTYGRTTGPVCTANCAGLRDGDYQSCLTCKGYISCVAGQIKYRRACPKGLVWNDVGKKCLRYSTTCTESRTTGPTCIPNCAGLKDGDYQSCDTCKGYLSCVAGIVKYRRPCPKGLVWNDVVKKCNRASPTCTEPSNFY